MPRTKLGSEAKKQKQEQDAARELEETLDSYFADCDRYNRLYSEAGIALALNVPLETLADWWDGKGPPGYVWPIKKAYLRLQNQIETDPKYREKGGMATRAIFALKQKRLGGWVDRVEAKQDLTVNVRYGKGMDETDF